MPVPELAAATDERALAAAFVAPGAQLANGPSPGFFVIAGVAVCILSAVWEFTRGYSKSYLTKFLPWWLFSAGVGLILLGVAVASR
jgi:predicted phage tail protein